MLPLAGADKAQMQNAATMHDQAYGFLPDA